LFHPIFKEKGERMGLKNSDFMSKAILLKAAALVLGASLLFSGPNYRVSAEPGPVNGVDAMFVMDTSYSMNDTDKDRIASEVMNMFIDMSEAARTRIGFVAYNHKIVDSQELTSLASAEQKSRLKKKTGEQRRSGYTDLGLGLAKGNELLQKDKSTASRPIMILLSDGGTDFGSISTGRSVEDSNRDVEETIRQAKEAHYPIYTIGLNHDGSVNEQQLKHIAEETGGTSFITKSADDLPEIFNKLFASHIQSNLVPVAAITATGELQEVTVSIPNSSMNESNIILLSEHPLLESHLYYNSSKNVSFIKSDKYSLMKIVQPQKGSSLLKFRGKAGDVVRINLLNNYNLEVQEEFIPKDAVKGKPALISTGLYRPLDGSKLEDKDVYQSLKADFIIKGKADEQEVRIPMNNTGNGFELKHTFPASGSYQARIVLTGTDFYRESPIKEAVLSNIAPQAPSSVPLLELTKEDGEIQLSLSDYFSDANDDPLEFTFAAMDDGDKLEAIIQDGVLTILPVRSGAGSFQITATDTEGGTATAVWSVQIESKWELYLKIGAIVLGLAAAGGFLGWFLRPRPKWAGRLEGYFLDTASGNDIPVKYWPLASLERNQSVSLKELFAMLDVNEPLPEAAKIVFEAGKNGTIWVKNTSRSTLQKGNSELSRNKKEALQYNDKLYITFEDRITEIELRYKDIKPGSRTA
jgi:hypothetical protein